LAFSAGLAFSATFLTAVGFSAVFLAGCCYFFEEEATAGAALLDETLARGLERERGTTETDLFTLASLVSAF